MHKLSNGELAGHRGRKGAVGTNKLSHSELPYKLSFSDNLWSP